MQRIQWLDAGLNERPSSSLECVVRVYELCRLRNRLSCEVTGDGIRVGVDFKNEGMSK
jgi:hypothetical protein